MEPSDNKFTNINNINYTNNTNNTNNLLTTFFLCDQMTTKKETEKLDTPSGRSGLASLSRPSDSPGVPGGVVLAAPPETLPVQWRGVKLDLFKNYSQTGKINLKLKIGIIRHDSTTQSFVAALNSPTNRVWVKVSDADKITAHWQLVKKIETVCQNEGIEYRVSKCSLPYKAGSTDLVVFLIEQDQEWIVTIVRDAEQFTYTLSKDSQLTDKQRQTHLVSTKYIGPQSQAIISIKELGL